jgi:hypothetical protein
MVRPFVLDMPPLAANWIRLDPTHDKYDTSRSREWSLCRALAPVVAHDDESVPSARRRRQREKVGQRRPVVRDVFQGIAIEHCVEGLHGVAEHRA